MSDQNHQQISTLLAEYAEKGHTGTFFMEKATEDFQFIRPSGNPIDAAGFTAMFSSGDINVSKSAVAKIHKLDVYGDIAFSAFTQTVEFTYKGTPNDDVCTVSALLKKVSGDWKIAWMQRSGGDADLESWS